MSETRLREAIRFINAHNRPGGRPLIVLARCAICRNEFASQVQDLNLSKSKGTGRVCPAEGCRKEARRRRQRGEWGPAR